MSRVYGQRVVISIPPNEEDDAAREEAGPVVPLIQLTTCELEAVHPKGLAGHPEIQSLQQWLDLNG